MSKIKYYTKQLIIFGTSKSAVMFAPIIAASTLSTQNYGLLEWSLSASIMFAVAVSLGSGGVIAFEVVKNEHSPIISISMIYTAILSFFLAATGLISYIIHLSNQLTFFLMFSGLFVAQFSLSAFMKAKGAGAYATIIDSLVYILIFLLAIFATSKNKDEFQYIFIFSVSAFFLSFIIYFLSNIKKNYFEISKFFLFLRRGIPIMLSSLMAIGFINLPRVLLGEFDSFEKVAEFSLLFRWAALALVVYQFVVVIKFREIYKSELHQIDRYFAFISIAIFFIGFAIILILNSLNAQFNELPFATPSQNFIFQSFMATSIALWVLSTSLEGIFYREHLAKYQFYSSLIGILIFLGIFFIIQNIYCITIFTVLLSWISGFCITIVTQFYFLNKKIYASTKNSFKNIKSVFLIILVTQFALSIIGIL